MASAAVATPAKAAKKTAPKAKKVASHPKYSEMVTDALTNLKERGGSSRLAVLKYITKKYNLGQDDKLVNAHLKMALRAGIKNGALKHTKGTGATGSFRVGDAVKKTKAGKKPKAAGAKKPKVAKKTKVSGSPVKAKKPKAAVAAPKVTKPKVAKKPKSPTKAPKAAVAKKPKAAKPAAPKAQKAKTAKPKKVAAKK